MSHTLFQEGVAEAAMKSEIVKRSSLSQAHQDLIQRAIEVKDSAYSRYSHFSVGSAVLTSSGKIYKGVHKQNLSLGYLVKLPYSCVGCNVDNSSHSLNTCAERVAITSAVSEGDKVLTAIAVVL